MLGDPLPNVLTIDVLHVTRVTAGASADALVDRLRRECGSSPPRAHQGPHEPKTVAPTATPTRPITPPERRPRHDAERLESAADVSHPGGRGFESPSLIANPPQLLRVAGSRPRQGFVERRRARR